MTETRVADAARFDEIVQNEFWSARSELAHIKAFAHARMCSPWAVLAVVLTRIACTVPPNVVLPPIVGGDGGLNLFAGLVGPSGSGKSGAINAARDAVVTEGFPTVPLGSGEGISRSYAYRSTKTQQLVWLERSVLFTATEVDALSALDGRQGATLGAQMREMFNGGELGFGYASVEKRVILPEHSYRAGVIVGIQPGRAAVLLDGEAGGMPQRFLFMPSTDPTIPRYPDPAPTIWTPPRMHWAAPRNNPFPEGEADTGRAVGPREELWVDPLIVDGIQKAAHQRATGIGQPLDGHALLVRLKVAAALSVLAGRKMIRDHDWDLAGTVMAVSDTTRLAMQAQLENARTAISERLGTAEGIRRATADEVSALHTEVRIAGAITKKLQTPPAPGMLWSRSALRKTFAYRDRDTFDTVLTDMFNSPQDLTNAQMAAATRIAS
ncbi:hypothetical protein [Nakamurella sp. PAMC28650]|uniref:hypothetical protein n=1 Tax=Nakamurella sp. PAMC28650 TaxID=2762325 RepID=UPI00164E749B|nr:hypothetical protein [Nakamurella sp. PAMC28650]QNK80415.1 hypothetical protein H7F38_19870 [Nakamurella sp. PAMC28650]